ncbi:MAG: hypothetical protein U0X71_05910 [Sphingobacteriaceae bacterium]|jgi:uncharacterized membrane protein
MQFWRNYKTTAIGFSLAVLLAVQPVLNTGAIDWKQLVVAIMVGALGFFAKDYNTR